MIWRDEFNKGEVLLRDLDATYAGPDAKAMSAPAIGPDGHANIGVAVPCRPGRPPQIPAPAIAPAIPFKLADTRATEVSIRARPRAQGLRHLRRLLGPGWQQLGVAGTRLPQCVT